MSAQGSRARAAAALAVRSLLDRAPAPDLSALLPPAELEALREQLRSRACEHMTFRGFLRDVLTSLPAAGRADGPFILAVARFARDVWHS